MSSFSSALNKTADDFNTFWTNGWNLLSLDPTGQAMMLVGLVHNTQVTSFQKDGFLFGGFNWLTDSPTATQLEDLIAYFVPSFHAYMAQGVEEEVFFAQF